MYLSVSTVKMPSNMLVVNDVASTSTTIGTNASRCFILSVCVN